MIVAAPPSGSHQKGVKDKKREPLEVQPQRTSLARKAKEKNWKNISDDVFHAFIAQTFVMDKDNSAFRIDLRQALMDKSTSPIAKQSAMDELKSLSDNETMSPIKYRSIPDEYRSKVVPSHMFLKQKYKADGTPAKIKSRFVINGKLEEIIENMNTRSPTVNPFFYFYVRCLVTRN